MLGIESILLRDRLSTFAWDIFRQKYAHSKSESWADAANRVATNVMAELSYGPQSPETERIERYIRERKFIPGGRYLYAAGRPLHQVCNCLLLRAEDSREGWGELWKRAGVALMTGAGVGVEYSRIREAGSAISRTGGQASGPCALMHTVNEIGRQVMQGGSRRSAIWAGLAWDHPDIELFLRIKDWSPELRALRDREPTFPAPMELTNVSIRLDSRFFEAVSDARHPDHGRATDLYRDAVRRMCRTGEPGFSVDMGADADEHMRNAPVAGSTHILTDSGYVTARELAERTATVWTGMQWVPNVQFNKTGSNVPLVRVTMSGGRVIECDPSHPFMVEKWCGAGKQNRRIISVERVPASSLCHNDIIVSTTPQPYVSDALNREDYTLGWIYGDGSFTKSGGADLTLCSPESQACASDIVGYNSEACPDSRGFTRFYFSVSERWTGRSKDTYPVDGGSPSFIAGLFDADGNWEPTQKRVRLASVHPSFLHGARRALEAIGILAHVSRCSRESGFGGRASWQLVVSSGSVRRFSDIVPTRRLQIVIGDYTPYRTSHVRVVGVDDAGYGDVFCADVGVSEHTFMAEGVIVSNCTEITTADSDDICNLGSINLARVRSLDEMRDVVDAATLFLLAGSEYTSLPYKEVGAVRDKNRRLGLGVMGVHEWLLARGRSYAPDPELGEWLAEYATSTDIAAGWADEHSLSRPVKTRAIAPTGTIGIIGETTTGIEPVYCTAYRRRYLVGTRWHERTIIDPTVARLVRDVGIDPEGIEDAHRLSFDPEFRIEMQAWVQTFVDHGISSTVNLPEPLGAEDADAFGASLLPILPRLRGITAYPSGARGLDPLEPTSYADALRAESVAFEESEERCVGGACGV